MLHGLYRNIMNYSTCTFTWIGKKVENSVSAPFRRFGRTEPIFRIIRLNIRKMLGCGRALLSGSVPNLQMSVWWFSVVILGKFGTFSGTCTERSKSFGKFELYLFGNRDAENRIVCRVNRTVSFQRVICGMRKNHFQPIEKLARATHTFEGIIVHF